MKTEQESNTAAVKRIEQAVNIAINILSPAWNQQAAVSLALRILDNTNGPLDEQLAMTTQAYMERAVGNK